MVNKLAIVLALVLIAGTVGAASGFFHSIVPEASSTSTTTPTTGSVATSLFQCSSLFSTSASAYPGGSSLVSDALTQKDTFTGMLEISMMLVLLVLAALGIVYAIGSAFNINKLTDFVRREYLETLANIIIIVIVLVGGFGIFNGATTFFADVAAAGVGSSTTPTASTGTGLTTNYVFVNTCTTYENAIIENNLINYFDVVFFLFWIDVEVTFEVNVDPNAFGFTLMPFTGVQTLQTAVWSEEAISFSIISMGALLILLLFVIYFLFPIFFYAGLVFRCLPWTRAAGGSMLALFISFYIFFPAMLYAFANMGSGSTSTLCQYSDTGTQALCHAQSNSGRLLSGLGVDIKSLINALFSLIGATSFGTAMYENVVDFTNSVSYAILQMIGMIISFIISYDLMEFLGDVLGSPSLQSSRILSKVI